MSINRRTSRLFSLLALLSLSGVVSSSAQVAPPDDPRTQKAEEILSRAVEASGGARYLQVRSTVARGMLTPMEVVKGTYSPPSTFVDYTIFPDRSRTEFKRRGERSIQTYANGAGWMYSSANSRGVVDLNPQQLAAFKFSVRTSIDYLLRGFWRKETGVVLSYVGRREAGVVGRRNETIKLTYADGFQIEYEFDARSGLPAKANYTRRNAEGEDVAEQDVYARYLDVNGVTLPFVIDHYVAGVQTSRVNIESIELDKPISDTLFARPASAKDVK